MRERILALQREALDALCRATSEPEIEEIRVRFLGRKGRLTELLRGVKDLPASERPVVGQMANEAKEIIARALETNRTRLRDEAERRRLAAERVDISLPGRSPFRGSYHPLPRSTAGSSPFFRGWASRSWKGPRSTWIFTTSRLSTCHGTSSPGHAGYVLPLPRSGSDDPHPPTSNSTS